MQCACGLPSLARGLCSAHYGRWKRTRDPRLGVPLGGPTVADRFWSKVDTSAGPDGCWPWTGSRVPFGYGRLKIAGRMHQAHRYALFGLEVPVGALALHRCDNPPCCNPAHLFSGTQRDNVRDQVAKGRARNQWHKLTPEVADAIRARYVPGRTSQQEVATSLGISQSLVSQVLRGAARPR